MMGWSQDMDHKINAALDDPSRHFAEARKRRLDRERRYIDSIEPRWVKWLKRVLR